MEAKNQKAKVPVSLEARLRWKAKGPDLLTWTTSIILGDST